MPSKIISLTLCLFFLCSATVFAQDESSDASEAPPALTPLQIAEQAKWDARIARSEGFINSMLRTKKGIELWRTVQSQYREKVAQSRSDCAAEVRRSNRDTLDRNKMLCLHRELILEKEMREKQSAFIDTLPGVDENRRAQAQLAISEFTEAIVPVNQRYEKNANAYTEA